MANRIQFNCKIDSQYFTWSSHIELYRMVPVLSLLFKLLLSFLLCCFSLLSTRASLDRRSPFKSIRSIFCFFPPLELEESVVSHTLPGGQSRSLLWLERNRQQWQLKQQHSLLSIQLLSRGHCGSWSATATATATERDDGSHREPAS